MADYENMYKQLFHKTEDVLKIIEKAMRKLVSGQRIGEELYFESDFDDEKIEENS